MAPTTLRPASVILGVAAILLTLLFRPGVDGARPFPPGDGGRVSATVARLTGHLSGLTSDPAETGTPEEEVEEEILEEEEPSPSPPPLPLPASDRAGFLVQVEVPAGEAPDGIHVYATVREGSGEGAAAAAEAAADGTAWIEVPPNRDVVLVARREGLLAGWTTERSPAAGGAARVRIPLVAGRTLSGTVLDDAGGSPVPGARVAAFPDTFPFG